MKLTVQNDPLIDRDPPYNVVLQRKSLKSKAKTKLQNIIVIIIILLKETVLSQNSFKCHKFQIAGGKSVWCNNWVYLI